MIKNLFSIIFVIKNFSTVFLPAAQRNNITLTIYGLDSNADESLDFSTFTDDCHLVDKWGGDQQITEIDETSARREGVLKNTRNTIV